MKKRLISFVLILCTVFSMLPVTAFAAEVVASGACGNNLSWTLDDQGKLTISGTGNMPDWNLLGGDTPWHEYTEQIITIEILEGITSIGEAAFSNCSQLTSVSIPESVTEIGTFAFAFCNNLQAIYIPAGVAKIRTYVFSACDALREITVSDSNAYFADLDGVLFSKNMDILIAWPGGKGNAQIPDTVTEIEVAAFANCANITEVIIPSNVTKINSYAFSGCDHLARVTIMQNPVFGDDPFYNCRNLVSFMVSPESTLYSSKDGVLYNKDQTELIQCPEKMGSIKIPETVTTIGYSAFYNCRMLESIQIPKSVTSIKASAFGQCSNIKEFVIPNGITAIADFTFSGCYSLSTVTIPASVARIGHWAFASTGKLRHVLYRGTEAQWQQVVLEDIKLSENAVVTYNYIDGMDYHVYSDNKDTECDICGHFRLVGCVDNALGIEITTKSNYDFKLVGISSDIVSVRFTGQSSLIIGNDETHCKGYALTFSQPGNYSLTFVQENTGAALSFSAMISGHTWDNVVKKEPTCTEQGYTTHACSCGNSYTTDEIAALGHNEVLDYGYAATCTQNGLTEGKHCDRCNAILIAQEQIPALGHNEVIDYGYAATCTQNGLTEGTHCDRCNTVLVAQEQIPAIRHDFVDGNCSGCDAKAARITGQPKTTYTKSGATAKVTVKAEGDGLSYQWYFKNAGSSKYSKSSVKSATYSTNMSSTSKDRYVYCVITDAYGNTVKTNTVRLRMAASITTQPKSVAVTEGATAKVTVKTAGDGLTYKWYYKNPGASKFSLTKTFTGNYYSLEMNEDRDGRQVYCVVTDKYGKTVKSDVVTLSMCQELKITTQPKGTYTKSGATAKVTVKAQGDGLTYQWYIKNAGSSKYSKSSVTSATYSAKMSSTTKDRYAYCVITDAYGNSVQTKTVRLRMAASITTQPKNVEVAAGKTAKVTVKATGDELTYKWYYKNPGASKFSLTKSFTGNYYSVEMNEDRDGQQVYCVVTDKYGKTVKSNVVTLSMEEPIEIILQPTNASAGKNKTVSVFVMAKGENLKYQWYVAAPGSTKFSKSSITDPNYSTTMSASRDGRKVYCLITDGNGNTVVTNTVTLRMK